MGESQIGGQPGLQGNTLSPKNLKKEKKTGLVYENRYGLETFNSIITEQPRY